MRDSRRLADSLMKLTPERVKSVRITSLNKIYESVLLSMKILTLVKMSFEKITVLSLNAMALFLVPGS